MGKKEHQEIDLEQELESLYRKVASADQPDDAPYPEPPVEVPVTASSTPRSLERQPSPAPVKGAPPLRYLRNLPGIMFLILVLGLYAFFFWPTIYDYNTLNRAGKAYPFRVNRLTGEAAYFDGTVWLHPPQTAAVANPVQGDPNDALAVIVPPETKPSEPLSADSAATPTPSEIRDKEEYTIQIRAFRENETAEARSFMEDAKRRLPGMRMKTVHLKRGDVWHRILVGTFASKEEASAQMQTLKLSETYPNSFITIDPQ